MSKVISNAADEVDEEFQVTDIVRNFRIAVTDYDWEYPKDENDYNNHLPREEEKDPLIDDQENEKDK